MARFAFILPRCGYELVGGGENLSRLLALELSKRGDHIEIFTTCALDNRTWKNELAAGSSVEHGVLVHRFPAETRDLESWLPKQIAISDGMQLSVDDQLEWMRNSISSSALYAELARRQQDFDALFFAIFWVGTSFWGSLMFPQKSVLIPCLHDEPSAYLDIISAMFREVRGCIFNCRAEAELAQRLYGDIAGSDAGMGFIAPALEEVNQLKPYFEDNFPYLLYLGRKETGKNAHLLIDHFIWAKENASGFENLKLVICGGGSFDDLLRPHAKNHPDIIDVSAVSELDKQRILKHALCLCQPSVNESFSIVIMEAWMLLTPVLVSARCPVTREHVVDSGGGLYFDEAQEFAAVVAELLENTALAKTMGAAGRRYVIEKYNWQAVLERFDRARSLIFESKPAPLSAES